MLRFFESFLSVLCILNGYAPFFNAILAPILQNFGWI